MPQAAIRGDEVGRDSRPKLYGSIGRPVEGIVAAAAIWAIWLAAVTPERPTRLPLLQMHLSMHDVFRLPPTLPGMKNITNDVETSGYK